MRAALCDRALPAHDPAGLCQGRIARHTLLQVRVRARVRVRVRVGVRVRVRVRVRANPNPNPNPNQFSYFGLLEERCLSEKLFEAQFGLRFSSSKGAPQP